MANYDYSGQTASIIYDEASNRVITVHPGGGRQSVNAGNDAAAAVESAKAHIGSTYTNVGNINVTQEAGASDRLAAETASAADAYRAAQVASGPPAEVNTYDGTSTYTGGVIQQGQPPSIRDIMDIGGVDFSTASDLSSTGSTTDTRDWNAIMNSGLVGQDLVDNIRAAKNEMYGGVTVRNGEHGMGFYAGTGQMLRGIGSGAGGNIETIRDNALSFGVKDDWYNTDWQGQSDTFVASLQPALAEQQAIVSNPNSTAAQVATATNQIASIQKQITGSQASADKMIGVSAYGADWLSPYKDWESTSGVNLTTKLPSAAEEKKKVEATQYNDTPLGVVDQTIQAPVAAPTYTAAPVATGNVQVASPDNVTPAPTQAPTYGSMQGTTGQTPGMIQGTFGDAVETGGTSAVPTSVTTYPNYTGITTGQLTSASQPNAGSQQVTYSNPYGQELTVTVINGQPMTYVPPGYTPKPTTNAITGMATGGTVQGYVEGGGVDKMLEAKFRIASMNGYNGPKSNASLNAYANASPTMTAKFSAIGAAMAQGGQVKSPNTVYAAEGTFVEQQAERDANLIAQTMQPIQSPVSYLTPESADFIGATAGQATPVAPFAEASTVQNVQQAAIQQPTATQVANFTPSYAGVQAETDALTAAQGTVSDEAQVTAEQQLTTSVSGMEAAQGTATMVNAPAAREIQAGEIISGVADAEKAATFNEQIEAATATPTKQATVAGQLEGLMTQFEGGNTPAWAAGSMRTAMSNLSARGLGASSMAGQAVIQAAMESALPIAQMDAQVQAQFEGQNLSNRQQRVMLAAQQRATFLGMEFDQDFQARVANSARVGDIANMNFTAEQNIAIENSRAANTMDLNNLSNRQAMVMSEAAALSNLDMANLNNRQQTAVQNAQNFLQMDMTNLSNQQQTTMFKAQQNIQAMFTDQAAENASAQFNASSQNQTDQYFANLRSQTSQFNASQQNAMDQFNVNSVNALREFNSEIQQQRDLFNAQNGLVIAQSNAQWRQNLSTINNASQNSSNMAFAQNMNELTARNLDSYWQTERDIMSFAFQTENSNADRATSVALQALKNEGEADEAAAKKSNTFSKIAGAVVEKMIFG